MSVSESSSYVAYLRKVARATNAAIASPVPVSSRTHHHHENLRRKQSAGGGGGGGVTYDGDSVESSYAYDYLREPPHGVLRGHRSGSGRNPSASPSTTRTNQPAKHTDKPPFTSTESKGSVQVTFDEMYAALKTAGQQEMEAAAASHRTTHHGFPRTPSCSPHPAPSTTSHACVSVGSGNGNLNTNQSGRRARITTHALHHGTGHTSAPTCFQHSWGGSSLTIHVPPTPAEENVEGQPRGRRTAEVGKTLTSTDTSALTSSPTKLTSSSSEEEGTYASPSSFSARRPSSGFACPHCCRRCDSCECVGRPCQHRSRGRGMPYPPQRETGQHSPSSATHFTCPYCCRRCDSCQCVDRPCQYRGRNSSSTNSASRWRVETKSPHRVSPDAAHRMPSPQRHTRVSSSRGVVDTVRLQWPNQPEVHESRLVPVTPPTQRSSHHHYHHHHHHRRARKRHEKETPTSSPNKDEREAKEAVLRDVAVRACTCYWSDFPDLTMAINPSSHAGGCPYQAHHALYDELMASVGSGQPDSDALSSTPSRASSTSSYSVEAHVCSAASKAQVKQTHAAAKDAQTAATTGPATAARDAVDRTVTHEAELQRLQRQRRRRLAEEEAAAKGKVQGRAAVIGSTRRRTYMEQLMDAARDTPSPTKPASLQKRNSTGQTRSKYPSPTSVVGVTVMTPPPAPPPLLPAAPTTTTNSTEPTPAPATPAAEAAETVAEEEVEANTSEADVVGADAAQDVSPTVPSPQTDAVVPQVAQVMEAENHEDREESETANQVSSKPIVEEPAEEETNPLRALSRPHQRPTVGVPGPGAYHVDVAYMWSSAVHGVRGAAMSKAARMPPIKSITPGPGAYNLYRSSKEAEDDENSKKKTVTAAATDGEAEAAETAGEKADGATIVAVHTIGKGVVFSSTSARQFQLQFGASYQRNTTWSRQTAALPGPGAYNIVDGDRIDQSRPLGAAKLGFQFAKSADGAHFTGLACADGTAAAAAAAASPPPTAEAATKSTSSAATAAAAAAPVVPWRDWAGGAYIGTSTATFWAHPSLTGGGRRTLPRRGEKPAEEEEEDAAAADAAMNAGGGVWRGVGSGVALRLTSQRFPVRSPSPNPATSAADATEANAAAAAGEKAEDGREEDAAAAMERLRRSRGEPGPASYETAAALKFVQKRAPEVSMTFKHDRGPRGPLQSTASAAAGIDGNATLPGPGSYDAMIMSDVWGPRRSPQWSFGTAARLPGTSFPSASGDAGTAALTATSSGAFQKEDGAQVPGPGAYDVDVGYRAVQPTAARAVVGAAPRFDDEASPHAAESGATTNRDGSRVGPGIYDVASAYDVLLRRVTGGALARAPRQRDEERKVEDQGDANTSANGEVSPGPGTYTLPPLPAVGPTAYLGTTAPRFAWERAELEKEHLGTTDEHDAMFLSDLLPGPGAYDVDAAAHLARRPGTVIGRATRSPFLGLTRTDSAPHEVGPGTYNLPSLPTGRSAFLSYAGSRWEERRGEFALVDVDVPGPGLYDPVDTRAAASRSFSLARTSARFADSPATTSATGLLATGPVRDDIPGPGAYDVNSYVGGLASRGSGGGAAFGTAPRFIDGDHAGSNDAAAAANDRGASNTLVGPGSYDPYMVESSSLPTYSFPRGPRFVSSDGSDNNGAGLHNHEDHDGGGVGVGPGTYEVVDLSPPGRSAVMGSAVARPYSLNGEAALYGNGNGTAVPGPGAYSPQYAQVERSVPQVALARAWTAAYEPEGSGLGPGQYDPQYLSDITAYVRGGSAFGTAPRAVNSGISSGPEDEEVPGPGAYEVRLTRDGQPLESGAGATAGYLFGTAPRNLGTPGLTAGSASSPSAGEVPGPGAYMPEAYTDMASDYMRRTATRMGSAPRTLLTDEEVRRRDIPGPGTYTPEAYTDMGSRAIVNGGVVSRIGTAPRSFAGDDEARAAVGPGPGAYEPNLYAGMAAEPSITFPRADSRAGPTQTETPGPGAYAPESSHNGRLGATGPRATQFGSAPRFQSMEEALENADAVPGPNTYSPVDAAVRAAVPAYRFGTAAAHPDNARGDASSIGGGVAGPTSALVELSDAVPGPGAYDVSRAARWVYDAGGSSAAAVYRFGTAARFDTGGAAADGVGPGAYDVARGLVRSSQMPSTAAYSFPRAPAHARAASAQVEGDASLVTGGADAGVPGPGAYSLDAGYRATLPRAVAVNLVSGGAGSASEDGATAVGTNNSNNGVPGPGAYQLPTAFPEGPQWGFGTAPRQPIAGSNAAVQNDGRNGTAALVGPGSYAVPPPPPLHGGVTVPRAVNEDPYVEHTASPGPGAYDVTDAYAKSSFSAAAGGVRIGTAPRYPTEGQQDRGDGVGVEAAVGGTPGPGAYSPNTEAASSQAGGRAGPTFSHALRMPSDGFEGGGTAALVGPGSYDLPSATATTAAAPSFGTAPRRPPPSFMAAAGSTGEVGPGSYSIASADAQVRPRAPAHFIIASRNHRDESNSTGGRSDPQQMGETADQPGPGSYDVPVEIQPHTRAALLLGRTADEVDRAAHRQTPGPGSYDPSWTDTAGAAAYRFGTAPTNRLPSTSPASLYGQGGGEAEIPGPGAYDSAAAFVATQTKGSTSGGITMRGRPVDRELERRSLDPGPGAYDTTSSAQSGAAPSFRFGTAPRMPTPGGDNSDGTVGPGAYDVGRQDGGDGRKAPSVSFTQAPRMWDPERGARESLPGPGAYEVAKDSTSAAPSFTIPRGPRPPLRTGDADASPMVGPGSYTPADGWRSTGDAGAGSAAATIGLAPRVWHTGNLDTPGPGSYDLQRLQAQGGMSIATAAAASSFGTAPRPDPAAGRCDTPGPGAYSATDPSAVSPAGPSFGSAARPDPTLNRNPGPGTYEYSAGPRTGSAGVTFGSAVRPGPERQSSASPGPGAYDAASSSARMDRHGGPSFGSSSRPTAVLNDNPGPGTYDSTAAHLTGAYGQDGEGGAAKTFAQAARASPVLNDNPGPGTYHTAPSSTAASGPAPSFGFGERPGPVINDNPGPGTYAAIHTMPSGAAPSFGFGERPNPVINDTPGPGTYSSVRAASDGAASSFGFGERPSPFHNDTPGPGAYSSVRTAGDGPAVGFGFGERPSPVLNATPGPGTYTSLYALPDGPAPSFGFGERRSPIHNDYPGPGAYYREAYVAQLTDVPGASFGRAERPSPTLNRNPGPGTYYRETSVETLRPTLGVAERLSGALGTTTTPGPGAYYKDDYLAAGVDVTRGVRIGSAERPAPILNANPGPGTYHRDNSSSSALPHAEGMREGGFGRSERPTPVHGDTPGPGTYFRGDAGVSVGSAVRGVTIGASERPEPKLNDNPGPGTYFRAAATDPPTTTSSSAHKKDAGKVRSKRPTAADTLRKLASVGYPLDQKD